MSISKRYKSMLDISATLIEYKGELSGKPSWRKKSKLKKKIKKLEEKLEYQSYQIIHKGFERIDSEKVLSVCLVDELNTLKSNVDDRHNLAIEDLKVRLSKLADEESKKTAGRRKFERHAVWVGIVLIGITMVSLKWFWLIDVNEPEGTPAHKVQQAMAYEKTLKHAESIGSGFQFGIGKLKSFFYWPIEPTEKEVDHGSEFLWDAVDVYGELLESNVLCNTSIDYQFEDQGDGDVFALSSIKDEIAIAQTAIDYINNNLDISSVDSDVALLKKAYMSEFSCP